MSWSFSSAQPCGFSSSTSRSSTSALITDRLCSQALDRCLTALPGKDSRHCRSLTVASHTHRVEIDEDQLPEVLKQAIAAARKRGAPDDAADTEDSDTEDAMGEGALGEGVRLCACLLCSV